MKLISFGYGRGRVSLRNDTLPNIVTLLSNLLFQSGLWPLTGIRLDLIDQKNDGSREPLEKVKKNFFVVLILFYFDR